MSDIEKHDPNFTVPASINCPGIKFYPADSDLFRLHGVFGDNGKFRRMPAAAARQVSDGVFALHTHTAGGRLRFITTSNYVAISAKMENIGKMPHITLTGSAGFDLYERIGGKQVYIGTFVPPYDVSDGYESILYLGNAAGNRSATPVYVLLPQ